MRIFQPDRVFLASFVERTAPCMQGKVVDVGGGNRRYATQFTHCAYETMDVDASQHPDHVGSVEHLPFEDGTIDGIICTQVLGDVENPKKAMQEIARVLRPGGKLILTESLFNEEHDKPHDYWRFTEQAYRLLLQDSFAIDVLETRGGYFSQIAQQNIRYVIERHRLYERPFLGRAFNILASVKGKIAMIRDRHDHLHRKFTIGHCILATKH